MHTCHEKATTVKREYRRYKAGSEFEYPTYRIIANYLDNTIRRYRRRYSAGRECGILSKEKLKAKGHEVEYQRGRSGGKVVARARATGGNGGEAVTIHNVQHNNGANICCRKVAFVIACTLDARETNVVSMRDEPYCGVRGSVCELRVYCSTW